MAGSVADDPAADERASPGSGQRKKRLHVDNIPTIGGFNKQSMFCLLPECSLYALKPTVCNAILVSCDVTSAFTLH